MHSKQKESTVRSGDISDKEYWDKRYKKRHGHSGDGSRGRILAYKAHTLNVLAQKREWRTIVDLGCGDGFLLPLIQYERYAGYDISNGCVDYCRKTYDQTRNRMFFAGEIDDFANLFSSPYDVSISFDVTFHITKDEDYNHYLEALISLGREVLVFSVNENNERMEELWGQEIPDHVHYRPVAEDLISMGMRIIEIMKCPFDARIDKSPGNTFSRMYLFDRQ